MKIDLFEFQKDALHEMRVKLAAARSLASVDNPQAVAFSAPTGSGKTVIMTALFEAILAQPGDQLEWPADWQPQRDAAILWVSDMPELNEQTRRKIESQSDRIHQVNRLITIDSSFDAERLPGGKVYFINTQKLGSDKLLTKEGDRRQYSIWTTLANTAHALPDRFYVVIDEAHRGMTGRGAAQARTLVQRFVLGHPDTGLPKMPLVIGVSATPQRFLSLLEHAPHTVHKVIVPAERVRESGLLKERILIHHPDAPTESSMTLLAQAARHWQTMSASWQAYCKAEAVDPTVWPVLVVQVEDRRGSAAGNGPATATNLKDVLNEIEGAIGRKLREGEVVHAMHDVADLDLDGRRVRKVEASRIQENSQIGVVLFKTSLSTGWDCPRAEVMMSFRRAAEPTYIAQLLGRTVRTPLARRIERDASLNDVHLYLPFFDKAAVEKVVEALKNEEEVPPSEAGSAADLVVLKQAAGPESAFAALAKCATYRVNAVRAQPSLRRYVGLAKLLTSYGVDADAGDAAVRNVIGWMDDALARMKQGPEYQQALTAIGRVGVHTLVVQGQGEQAEEGEDYDIEVSDTDIDRLFADAGRLLGRGLHVEYWRPHVNAKMTNAREVKVDVIALSKSEAAMQALQRKAETAFTELFDANRRKIGDLKEQQRQACERLRLGSSKPVAIEWELPPSVDWRRAPDDSTHDQHLYVEDSGEFRCALGPWEVGVLQEELANGAKWWLRNPSKKPWSLEIPYESGGAIKPMFPDLVVLRADGKRWIVDVLEPHDPSRGDNFEKAKGLAKFAEEHGGKFGRIQLIREMSSPTGANVFKRLDLNREAVRREALALTGNPQLNALFERLAS
jgi:type III restriction enzyme